MHVPGFGKKKQLEVDGTLRFSEQFFVLRVDDVPLAQFFLDLNRQRSVAGYFYWRQFFCGRKLTGQ